MVDEEPGPPAPTEAGEPSDGDPMPPARIADIHAGQYWISEDFDAPLPESFWVGEE